MSESEFDWQPVNGTSFTDIRYEKLEGIAKITINRPEVRNAFRPLTVIEMREALQHARRDGDVGVIVITGEGEKAFCAGGDQKIRGDAGYKDESGTEHLNVLDFQREIRTCPKPVIAMVAGFAVGGGHVLHVVCDLTIAADNAIFGQTGPKVGSFDGGYGASYLARSIGQKRAREIWFLCRQYDARQALEMGLVNAVVPYDQMERETVQWCREILSKSPIAIRCLKAAMNADCDGQTGLQELAGNATMLFYMTEEGREGRDAFVEKRRLIFRSSQDAARKRSVMLRHWILAARPKTLVASICPVMIGVALAAGDEKLHLLSATAALVGAMAIQIGTNFCNDYFDFRQGADTDQRKGPTRAVQAGLISPSAMLRGTVLMFGITGCACAYLVARAGWPLAMIGVISVACGVWYTASRFSLAYLGLGDLFVFVFFGPIAVAGTYYVQALQVESRAIVAGFATGLLSVAILVVNNLRDIAEDALAEKRTLAVRFGRSFARCEYLFCIAGASLVPWLLWQFLDARPLIMFASFAILPGLWIAYQLWNRSGKALNPLLGMTAGVLLLFTVTFSWIYVTQ